VVMERKPRAVPACPMGGRKALGIGHDSACQRSESVLPCVAREPLNFLEPITIRTRSSRALRKRCFR
jgi:hypothetical protein